MSTAQALKHESRPTDAKRAIQVKVSAIGVARSVCGYGIQGVFTLAVSKEPASVLWRSVPVSASKKVPGWRLEAAEDDGRVL